MVDTIFSSASRQRQRARTSKESSKDKSRSAEDRKYLKSYSKETDKRAKKIEENKKRIYKKVAKALQKKVVSRKLLKDNQATVTIKQRDRTSILNEPGTFFKEEMEETKNAMFFR